MVVAINQTNSFNVILTDHSIKVTKIIHAKAYSLTAPTFSLKQLSMMLAMSDEDFALFAKMQQDRLKDEDEQLKDENV